MIRKEGDQVTVADGDVQATVHESKLTNDLDVVDKIRAQTAKHLASATALRSATAISQTPTPIPTPSDKEKRIKALEIQQANTTYAVERLRLEIAKFPGERIVDEYGTHAPGIRAPVSMHNELDKLEHKLKVIELNLRTLQK